MDIVRNCDCCINMPSSHITDLISWNGLIKKIGTWQRVRMQLVHTTSYMIYFWYGKVYQTCTYHKDDWTFYFCTRFLRYPRFYTEFYRQIYKSQLFCWANFPSQPTLYMYFVVMLGQKTNEWTFMFTTFMLCRFLGYAILRPGTWVTVLCVNVPLLFSGLKQAKLVKCLVICTWGRWNMKHTQPR
jgi:hypothetical protein